MSEHKKNLYYLSDLSDYKVASDNSDVRGWEVEDTDHRIIGKVDRLLVNKNTERVVYLDIEVDNSLIEDGHEVYNTSSSEGVHEFLNKDGENHLIIPIGLVNLDKENKKVVSNEITHSTFAKTKRLGKGTDVDRDYEVSVFKNYFPEKQFDENDLMDENFYNRREFQNSKERE
ncbi:PRC-barrel domain-containing protein [Algoriphagus sp.]|uniref:PRC-barrel domain-containing protein n=1 Tax=Algoriphagus sp. TaxID=1872435 RepID=UPI00391D05B7